MNQCSYLAVPSYPVKGIIHPHWSIIKRRVMINFSSEISYLRSAASELAFSIEHAVTPGPFFHPCHALSRGERCHLKLGPIVVVFPLARLRLCFKIDMLNLDREGVSRHTDNNQIVLFKQLLALQDTHTKKVITRFWFSSRRLCSVCSFYKILLPPTTPPSMLCDDCFRAELSKNSLLFGLLCCGFTLLLLQIKAYISHRPCKLGPPF